MATNPIQVKIGGIDKVQITTVHKFLEYQRNYLWKFSIYNEELNNVGGNSQCSVQLIHCMPSNKYTVILNGTQTLLKDQLNNKFGQIPFLVQMEPIVLHIQREEKLDVKKWTTGQAFDLYLNSRKYSQVLVDFNGAQLAPVDPKSSVDLTNSQVVPLVLEEPTGSLRQRVKQFKVEHNDNKLGGEDWYNLTTDQSKDKDKGGQTQQAESKNPEAQQAVDEFAFNFSYEEIKKQQELQENLVRNKSGENQSAEPQPEPVLEQKISAPPSEQQEQPQINNDLADMFGTTMSQASLPSKTNSQVYDQNLINMVQQSAADSQVNQANASAPQQMNQGLSPQNPQQQQQQQSMQGMQTNGSQQQQQITDFNFGTQPGAPKENDQLAAFTAALNSGQMGNTNSTNYSTPPQQQMQQNQFMPNMNQQMGQQNQQQMLQQMQQNPMMMQQQMNPMMQQQMMQQNMMMQQQNLNMMQNYNPMMQQQMYQQQMMQRQQQQQQFQPPQFMNAQPSFQNQTSNGSNNSGNMNLAFDIMAMDMQKQRDQVERDQKQKAAQAQQANQPQPQQPDSFSNFNPF